MPVVIILMAGLWGCSPLHTAYFQPEQRTSPSIGSPGTALTRSADTLSTVQPLVVALSDSVPTVAQPVGLASGTAAATSVRSSGHRLNRHTNPEGYQHNRFSRLFASIPVAHVAPKTYTIDRHSRSRKTYSLVWVALGLALVSLGSLFVTGGGILLWITGITLPLAATLMGVASLSTINRNQDRFRGKGWAMGAILLATGVLGLALVALATLSVSNVVWKK